MCIKDAFEVLNGAFDNLGLSKKKQAVIIIILLFGLVAAVLFYNSKKLLTPSVENPNSISINGDNNTVSNTTNILLDSVTRKVPSKVEKSSVTNNTKNSQNIHNTNIIGNGNTISE